MMAGFCGLGIGYHWWSGSLPRVDYEHEHGMMSVLFFSGLFYVHYSMAFDYIFAYDICDLYELEIQKNLYTASPKDIGEIAGRMCRSHSTQWLISLASPITRGVEGWSACMYILCPSGSARLAIALYFQGLTCAKWVTASLMHMWLLLHRKAQKKEIARKTQDKTVGQTWIWIHFVASRAHIPRSGAQPNSPKEATK
jgi:hypothetical protein